MQKESAVQAVTAKAENHRRLTTNYFDE